MATARFYITTVASASESGTEVPPHLAFDALTNFTPTFSQKLSSYALSSNSSASDHIVKDNPIFNVTGMVSTQPLTSFYNNMIGYDTLSQRPQSAYNLLKKWYDNKTQLYIYSEYDVYSPLIITQFIPLNEGFDSIKLDLTLEKAKFVGYSRVTLTQYMYEDLSKEGSSNDSGGGTSKKEINTEDNPEMAVWEFATPALFKGNYGSDGDSE